MTYTVKISNPSSTVYEDLQVIDQPAEGIGIVYGSTLLTPSNAGTTGYNTTLANKLTVGANKSVTLTYQANAQAIGDQFLTNTVVITDGGRAINAPTATATISYTDSCLSSINVSTESDLNFAIDCFNNRTQDVSITLLNDILLQDEQYISNNTSGIELKIDGAGFAIDGQNSTEHLSYTPQMSPLRT